MLEVKMIEFVSPDKYPRIMLRGEGGVSQYLEKSGRLVLTLGIQTLNNLLSTSMTEL